MSRGGRFLSFIAELESGSSGVFSIDLQSTAEPVVGYLGLNQATLVAAGGGPVAGTTMTLELDKAQSLQAAGLLGLSTSPPSAPCGVLLPGKGELLLGLPILVLDAGVWSGSPLSIDLAVPASLVFVGTVVHAQGAFIDPAPGAAEPVRLSDGLALRIGAN